MTGRQTLKVDGSTFFMTRNQSAFLSSSLKTAIACIPEPPKFLYVFEKRSLRTPGDKKLSAMYMGMITWLSLHLKSVSDSNKDAGLQSHENLASSIRQSAQLTSLYVYQQHKLEPLRSRFNIFKYQYYLLNVV